MLLTFCLIATVALTAANPYYELQKKHYEDECYVQLKNGNSMLGRYRRTHRGRTILSFTGIPYAKPPCGNLRFKPPVKIGKWEGILDASLIHAPCIQRNSFARDSEIIGQEDCLYLNVYTPNKTGNFPVLFYIHGEGWVAGSGNPTTYTPEHLLERDVVLVTINYRLGSLGFFSTGDECVPGNNGLKDMALALKWVHTNIGCFGGDAGSVTVFGNFAGAASAHFFMFSPLTKGLFHRVISQSGTAFCPWALSVGGTTVDNSRKLAKLFHCNADQSGQIVECLLKVSPQALVAADIYFHKWDTNPMIYFKPVIECANKGAFLPEHPIEVLKKGEMCQVPWMAGINSQEGILRTAPIYGDHNLLDEYSKDITNKIKLSLMLSSQCMNAARISKDIKQYYFCELQEGQKLGHSEMHNFTNLYTDGLFLHCINDAITLHMKYSKSPIYLYKYSYRGETSLGETLGDKLHQHEFGTCHGDENVALFPIAENLFYRNVCDDDLAMSNIMTAFWFNFASCGNPTPTAEFCTWGPVISAECSEYLHIHSPKDLKMEAGLYLKRSKFWRKLPINPSLGKEIIYDY